MKGIFGFLNISFIRAIIFGEIYKIFDGLSDAWKFSDIL